MIKKRALIPFDVAISSRRQRISFAFFKKQMLNFAHCSMPSAALCSMLSALCPMPITSAIALRPTVHPQLHRRA